MIIMVSSTFILLGWDVASIMSARFLQAHRPLDNLSSLLPCTIPGNSSWDEISNAGVGGDTRSISIDDEFEEEVACTASGMGKIQHYCKERKITPRYN